MNIQIIHSNEANHPDYEEQVAKCLDHGMNLRRWGAPERGIWFCGYCGHRVKVVIY